LYTTCMTRQWCNC